MFYSQNKNRFQRDCETKHRDEQLLRIRRQEHTEQLFVGKTQNGNHSYGGKRRIQKLSQTSYRCY